MMLWIKFSWCTNHSSQQLTSFKWANSSSLLFVHVWSVPVSCNCWLAHDNEVLSLHLLLSILFLLLFESLLLLLLSSCFVVFFTPAVTFDEDVLDANNILWHCCLGVVVVGCCCSDNWAVCVTDCCWRLLTLSWQDDGSSFILSWTFRLVFIIELFVAIGAWSCLLYCKLLLVVSFAVVSISCILSPLISTANNEKWLQIII